MSPLNVSTPHFLNSVGFATSPSMHFQGVEHSASTNKSAESNSPSISGKRSSPRDSGSASSVPPGEVENLQASKQRKLCGLSPRASRSNPSGNQRTPRAEHTEAFVEETGAAQFCKGQKHDRPVQEVDSMHAARDSQNAGSSGVEANGHPSPSQHNDDRSADAQSAVAALAMLHGLVASDCRQGQGPGEENKPAIAQNVGSSSSSQSHQNSETHNKGTKLNTHSNNQSCESHPRTQDITTMQVPMLVKSDGHVIPISLDLLQKIQASQFGNKPGGAANGAVYAALTSSSSYAGKGMGQRSAKSEPHDQQERNRSAANSSSLAEPTDISTADAQAIAALQELGSGEISRRDRQAGAASLTSPQAPLTGNSRGYSASLSAGCLFSPPYHLQGEAGLGPDGSVSPASGGGAGINSRHGAARGRQVTRSCPGCGERISIACKFCTLCGHKFRGAMQREGSRVQSPTGRGDETPSSSAAERARRSPSITYSRTQSSAFVAAMVLQYQTLPSECRPAAEADHAEAARVAAATAEAAAAAAEPTPGSECRRLFGVEDAAGDAAGAAGVRPTVTRVTPNSLELHKIKEQERRAREKQLLAKLQALLFDEGTGEGGADKGPSAAEVTYNHVLERAVQRLQERRGRRAGGAGGAAWMCELELEGHDGSESVATTPVGGGGRGDTEKHKIKEQQRRARKRQLLTALQNLVLG